VKAGYVRNIERDPHVRLRLREGLRYHWHAGTGHLLPDDDPRERQRWLANQLPSSAGNARAVACSGRNSSVFELIWTTNAKRIQDEAKG
jgi:hypothetical protein